MSDLSAFASQFMATPLASFTNRDGIEERVCLCVCLRRDIGESHHAFLAKSPQAGISAVTLLVAGDESLFSAEVYVLDIGVKCVYYWDREGGLSFSPMAPADGPLSEPPADGPTLDSPFSEFGLT